MLTELCDMLDEFAEAYFVGWRCLKEPAANHRSFQYTNGTVRKADYGPQPHQSAG
jgi:hypothetical protein